MFVNLWNLWSVVLLFCLVALILSTCVTMIMKARRQPIIIVDENRRVHGYRDVGD